MVDLDELEKMYAQLTIWPDETTIHDAYAMSEKWRDAVLKSAPELIKMARRWKHLEKQFRIYQADIGNRHTWIWTVSGANTMRGATFADAVDNAILSNSPQLPTEER